MSDQPTPPGATPPPPALSENLQVLSQAIRARGGPTQVVMCGFDLWLEVMGSGHTSTRDFLPGGLPARGDEPPEALKVPVIVLGGQIVISFDPTIPPDKFVLKP